MEKPPYNPIMVEEIEKIFDGIDRTQTDEPHGWWETGTGHALMIY